MMKGLLALCLLVCFAVGEISCYYDDFMNPGWNPHRNICDPGPDGRVPWIIHMRNPSYGWNEHTHRANIALAVNKYKESDEAMRKMELQLEVEVTRALFRNDTTKIYEHDLAMFIHALLATNKNPRNFHGTDLVADLLHRVDKAIYARETVHPFLVLALCNSHVVTLDHLENIKVFAQHDDNHADLDGRATELKALTLKTFACAASLSRNLAKFPDEMKTAADCLKRRQGRVGDGSFGNVYTTSLAVQALTAAGRYTWDEDGALVFLEREAYINVNMIKAYYIEMALNARNVKFIKDLYKLNGGIPVAVDGPGAPTTHYVTYTIKPSRRPEYFFSVIMQVEPTMNFFDIMTSAQQLSDRFNFKSTLNRNNLPMVHMVAGMPNDAEENMFWRICRQTDVDHDRHVSNVTDFRGSPINLIPVEDEHIIVWYLDTECPKK